MKNLHVLLVLAGSAFLSGPSMAQVNLNGEIRPRTEFRNGYQTPMDSVSHPALSTSQRTRLNFGYTGDHFKTNISVQDVSTWGNKSQLAAVNNGGATTFIHQAWGQYFFTPKCSFKIGRQILSYDDERLFGVTEWAQQGRAHDAIAAIYEDTASKFTLNAVAAYNAASVTNTASAYAVAGSYKEMQLLWINKVFGPVKGSLIFANIGNQSTVGINASRSFQTFGTYLEYKKDALFASARFYDQMSAKYGSATFGAGKQMQAWMAGVDIQYTLVKKITLGLGAEMMTGQSSVDTTKAYTEINHAFNPLFGSGHKFNGYMDYFYAGSAHNNQGLNDLYFKAKYKAEKYWFGLDAHLFMAGADVLDFKNLVTNGTYKAMDSNLGTEIDLTVAYNFSPAVTLQAGYSHFLLTETTAAVKNLYKSDGTPDARQLANWAYIMISFKPSFIK